MDLIYANKQKQDIGVLMSYDFDMAYGSDENDFECTINREAHCCQEGFLLYVEHEEYGGIIDRIRVNTEKDEVTYMGRTWHGVLEGKVICPEAGQDYLLLDGEANEVLQDIIDMIGLSDLFEASEEDSGIDIVGYQMERYVYGYTGIKKMLKAYGAKLLVSWVDGMVQLSAATIDDYSQDEEFDTSQVHFTIEKDFLPVNHMICLGQGDLRKRAVIHIFTDANGGIQQYASVSNPVKDADYILDESRKLMTGPDEVVQILDYPGAEITTNYVLLTSQPSDWAKNCEAYFYRDGDDYESVELEEVKYSLQLVAPADWSVNYSKYYSRSGNTYNHVTGSTVYELLAEKPSDWSAKYEKYYTKNGSTYPAVQGVTNENYILQTKRPKDWAKEYGSYYYYYSDGVVSEYRAVEGIAYDEFVRQTQEPTDWYIDEGYKNYYRKATKKELRDDPDTKYYQLEEVYRRDYINNQPVVIQGPPYWQPRRYYTKYTRYKTPPWKAVNRYTYIKTISAPTWAANTYYKKIDSTAPTWAANTYYTETDEKVAPKWVTKKYYKQVLDRYAVMVAEAVTRLEEAHEADYLSIDLAETEQTYDVGDLVGSIEEKTGISCVQEVVKKIIKITNDDIKISYEVS